MKKCTKCGVEKELSEFPKRKESPDGYRTYCRVCKNKQDYEYSQLNIVKVKQNKQRYIDNNPERIKATVKASYHKNKAKKKVYLASKQEESRVYAQQYYQANKVKMTAKLKERRDTDSLYKLSCNLRGRIRQGIKNFGSIKNTSSSEILGAPFEIVRKFISRKFKKGMSWSNHGDWHIDHKIPLSSANTEEELIKLCHYTNLQPLWGTDNLKKGIKILPVQTTMTL